MNVIVRNVNDEVWRTARVKAINAGVSMTRVIQELIEMWASGRVKIDTDELKPKKKGDKRGNHDQRK
jgi:plasmid stability protein